MPMWENAPVGPPRSRFPMQTHKNLTEKLEPSLQPNTPTQQMEGMCPISGKGELLKEKITNGVTCLGISGFGWR